MKLRSQSAFWPLQDGLIETYPSLKRDETCDVAIIDAGIAGALIAHRLSGEGMSCVVVDGGHVGGGSTSASTALLQYEIDEPLFRLIEKRGEDHATRAYQLCADAITKIENLRKVSLYRPGRPLDASGRRDQSLSVRPCFACRQCVSRSEDF